jgi:hypothetical protein
MPRKLAPLMLFAALAGCGQPPAGTASPATPPPSLPPETPVPSPTSTPPTLPAGVAFVHDGVLAPGTYWFCGFEPWLQLEVDGPGWEVGHFHDEEFDLFLNGTFPSIGFARFPAVATAASSASSAGSSIAATSIAAILEAWRSNPRIVIAEVGPVTIAGLAGTTVDVRVTAEQTPLFGAGSAAFKFNPGLDSQFHLLAVDGGVVEVFIVGQKGGLDAAIEAVQAIVDSLRVVG